MWRRGGWSSQLRRVHTIDPAAACYQLPNTPAAAAVTLLHPPSLSLLPLQGLAGRWWAPFSWCPPLVTSPPWQSCCSPFLLSVITLPSLVSLTPQWQKLPFAVSYVLLFPIAVLKRKDRNIALFALRRRGIATVDQNLAKQLSLGQFCSFIGIS